MVLFLLPRGDFMDFQAFTKSIIKDNLNVYGVEIYENGNLIHFFGDTANRHPIYSATKTITSIAAGIASDEGKLDIFSPLLRYLPESIISQMSFQQQEIYRHITIERLMTMSVIGYPFRPSGQNWLLDSISYPVDPATREFDYSNISAYLTGVAVTNAINEDLYSYLERKLFNPLDIIEPAFARSPEGYFYGASSMELSVNELSRIGLLLYNKGMYNGRRVVSERYINEATSVKQTYREGGYGYFIWKYRDGFSINGKWKQKCFVLHAKGLIITFLSHIEDKCDLIQSMERHLLDI